MTKDEEQKKPGPESERLVIEEDPKEALDRLLRKEPKPKAVEEDEALESPKRGDA